MTSLTLSADHVLMEIRSRLSQSAISTKWKDFHQILRKSGIVKPKIASLVWPDYNINVYLSRDTIVTKAANFMRARGV